eukprot:s739_g6.t1
MLNRTRYCRHIPRRTILPDDCAATRQQGVPANSTNVQQAVVAADVGVLRRFCNVCFADVKTLSVALSHFATFADFVSGVFDADVAAWFAEVVHLLIMLTHVHVRVCGAVAVAFAVAVAIAVVVAVAVVADGFDAGSAAAAAAAILFTWWSAVAGVVLDVSAFVRATERTPILAYVRLRQTTR